MPQILKDDIREKILEKALYNFSDKGYSRTSMKNIAYDTGIAVGNIYRYFRNKEDLFEAVAAPVHDKIIRLFTTADGKGSLADIEKKINEFIDIYHSNRRVFIMLLNNNDSTRFADMTNNIVENFSHAIGKWKEKTTGELNTEDDCIFIKAFSTAYLNGVLSILSEPADESVVSRRLFDFLFFMKDGLFSKYHKISKVGMNI